VPFFNCHSSSRQRRLCFVAVFIIVVVEKLNMNLSVLGSEDNDMSHVDKVSAFIISLQL
jgi:hypothetical protein